MNRRMFAKSATASAAAGLGLTPRSVFSGLGSGGPVVAGKDDRLVVHEAKIAVLETPANLLGEQVTPLQLLFVRNNQQPANAATMKPLPIFGWKIELSGLINGARSVAASELTAMQQVEREMVLQCSGNGRALFAEAVKTKGTQWIRGGMGNLRVTGVPVSAIIEKLGVKLDKRVEFVTAEGIDAPAPGKEDFEHSLPLEDVLNGSILALQFNGKPIPAIHGGPVRLMTPGYYGTMHVKWLSRLRFEPHETDNYNQIPRYRTPRSLIKPGEAIKYTFDNSQASWRMKIKSVVLTPQPGESLTANGRTVVRGVAFNDGTAPLEAVLVSVNRGRTWTPARLERSSGPYAWRRWSLPVTLSAGRHEIWTRSIDALGRSQPLDGSIHWNPSGYEWNGVEKIPVTAT